MPYFGAGSHDEKPGRAPARALPPGVSTPILRLLPPRDAACIFGRVPAGQLQAGINDLAEMAAAFGAAWTRDVNDILSIPVAHNEGRFVVEDDTLKKLQDDDRIAFFLFVGGLANPFSAVELAFPLVGKLEFDELVRESFRISIRGEKESQRERSVNLFHISRLSTRPNACKRNLETITGA